MSGKRMLFEISWEVCNMVGGIHTVLATKVAKMHEIYGDNYIVIGPDMSKDASLAGVFRDDIWSPEILKDLALLPLGVRMGRWLVPGEPRCLLLQFDSMFEKKDQILAEYWEHYSLNSLSGGADYIEPVLFAHAAGMVIEKIFVDTLLPKAIETVAHCHEWLACAAVLYLKERAPEIGTVFTTHATMLGRTLSSHHWDPGQVPKEKIQPEYLAQQYGVAAKHSLESISARAADCFSTVSEITGEECELLYHKKPDILLLNALGDNVPDPKFLEKSAVERARVRLLQIASLTTGHAYLLDQTTLLVSAGRYEFENKGVDVTLEALSRLNSSLKDTQRHSADRVISFLMFPAGHTGPRPKILEAHHQGRPSGDHYFSTHGLRDEEHDPIMTRMTPLGFRNGKEDMVHVVFIPIYLNGTDPLIAETYYELLAGADLTIFPSFYEPWGYTPAESMGLAVPTITSDLAGCGLWAQQFGDFDATGAYSLHRKGQPNERVVEELTGQLQKFLKRTPAQKQHLHDAALATSNKARWREFGEAYRKAHEMAILAAKQRMGSTTYDRFRSFSTSHVAGFAVGGRAHIRQFNVENRLPLVLERLKQLYLENLWWCWNPESTELLSELDPDLWLSSNRNPLMFLDKVRPELLDSAAKSKSFQEKVEIISSRFKLYLSTKKEAEVAYFCMEYGLTPLLRLYSGGLGILAGDHLKTASDMGIPLLALGLAYHHGYFRQQINFAGGQDHFYETNDFGSLPMSAVKDAQGNRLKLSIEGPGGAIWMQAWKIAVGRVDLYLLDTDISDNSPADRAISDRLYGGDTQHRLRQEFVLAIGGFELLKCLDLKPKVYHMNEGHTAFLVLARIERLMKDEKIRFEEAIEYVRHTTGFTTHTPVAAGHDHFPEAMAIPYLELFAEAMGEPVSKLQDLGRGIDKSRGTAFSMTLLAVRGSSFINGVSQIHGRVSRRMFNVMVPQYHENEVPVGAVTNGVHAPTWLAPEWQKVFAQKMGNDWREHLPDQKYWAQIQELDPETVWNTHQELKKKLVRWLKNHIRDTWSRRRENPATLATALASLTEDTFIATFARRFAPYKRANLLFRNPARLAELLRGETPMVFLFAGKAHPSDTMGQQLITQVIELSRNPEFCGRILFIENYEIDVAQSLVWGSDLWINTPVRPMEASGTSGMKAAMNGCLNLSVADGWWAEAYNGANGWVIGDDSMNQAPEFQDTFDSAHLYSLLEREVLPKFSGRARGGIPKQWVQMMKESIATNVPRFNTERMLGEYHRDFYAPSTELSTSLRGERFTEIHRLVASRKRLVEHWKTITFQDIDVKGLEGEAIELGAQAQMRVKLSHPHLRPQDLQLQAVLARETTDGDASGFRSVSMKCVADENDGRDSVWETTVAFDQAGPQSLGVRVIPRPCHERHQVDLTLDLVKWL